MSDVETKLEVEIPVDPPVEVVKETPPPAPEENGAPDEVVIVPTDAPKKSLFQRAKEALFAEPEIGAFHVFKGSDGKAYWIAKYTNAYEDKEKEIFTEKAHEEFIQRVDMGLVDKPELWTWHTKGTKHGQADTVFGVGRILVAVGHFDDTPEAQKAIKFYQKNAGKIKLSHGALVPKWAINDGLIASYNTFEISTLPNGTESNPYTSYEAIKSMQPDPKKLEWVATVLGKEKAEEIVKGTAEYSKALDEMQVRYKDFAQTSATPDPEPATEAQKNMGEVFIEMVKEQGDIVTLLAAMEKRQNQTDEIVKSLKAQNEGYVKEVTELRALVNAGPRRPSTDAATLVTDAAEVAKAKESTSDVEEEFKNRYGVPMKSGNGSNSNGHG